MVIGGRPKCIYGCMDVGVLNRREAMEIIFLVRVEDGPPSKGVLPAGFILEQHDVEFYRTWYKTDMTSHFC